MHSLPINFLTFCKGSTCAVRRSPPPKCSVCHLTLLVQLIKGKLLLSLSIVLKTSKGTDSIPDNGQSLIHSTTPPTYNYVIRYVVLDPQGNYCWDFFPMVFGLVCYVRRPIGYCEFCFRIALSSHSVRPYVTIVT